MRSIVIGDIHGCDGALRELLRLVKPDTGADRLIFLGDLFDRGPASWEVLRDVKSLAAAFGERFTLLRGNHEDFLLRECLTLAERRMWNRVGRKATAASFRAHGERMEDCAPWLREHTVLFYKGEGFQCAHAGVAAEPIEENDPGTLMHDHEIVWCNEYAGPLTITGHIALEDPAWFMGDGENMRWLHDDVEKPLPDRGVICIDTGCGKGGRLTAMVIEGGFFRLTSVPEE